ncbi:MAG: metal ABC transporter ATP-binding protein [Candidatus Alcyoniella australis]|nr:metal ABC transporter ATP-binding protein [Candidatus Alcyoniella australis]
MSREEFSGLCTGREQCTCVNPQIIVRGVSFAYAADSVLRDVYFHVDQGEFVGLIGPNGGGKTTLLKLVVGLLRPDAGDVLVFGRPPQRLGRLRADLGYVPQQHVVDWRFPVSAWEVVAMGGYAQRGVGRRVGRDLRQRSHELLELVGMERFADRPIGQLSGGQQQRVFIARALVTRPRLLILDEPTSGVDSWGQTRLFELIRELMQQMSLAVLIVSHDLGPMKKFADKLACLNRTMHFHGRSELLDERLLDDAYACELDEMKRAHIELRMPDDG